MIEYFKNVMDILEESLESIDEKIFEKLIKQCNDVLDNGNKIIVTGLGKNVPICDKFVGTLISLGINAYFLHTNSAIHGDIGIVRDGDLVIVLTKSGSTSESIYLVNQLKNRNITTWLISFCKEGILSKEMKNVLLINLRHESDLWNVMPNNSTTLNLIVLQAIAMRLAVTRNISINEFKKNHPGGHIGEILNEVNHG